MKLAIHPTKGSFSDHWISFCNANNISYKQVDCYRTDIMLQLSGCDAFMWHFSQNNPKAILFAKQLLYSVEASGRKVFPNFNTIWHFDDKVGQKYLLESIGAPLVPTWVFYDKSDALQWIKEKNFPKVFKLRGGASSENVRLVRNRKEAKLLVSKAFGSGFPNYYAMGSLHERWRLFRLGKTGFQDIIEGVVRFVIPPTYSGIKGNDKGYIYFQDYLGDNDHDIRVIVIGCKAFAIKRLVRNKDFRASGSGEILYDHKLFKESTIMLSFDLASKLKSQCIAFDYIQNDGKDMVIEISYGFSPDGYKSCPGYWDQNLIWHEGKFNPYGWMVENLVESIGKDRNPLSLHR